MGLKEQGFYLDIPQLEGNRNTRLLSSPAPPPRHLPLHEFDFAERGICCFRGNKQNSRSPRPQDHWMDCDVVSRRSMGWQCQEWFSVIEAVSWDRSVPY